MDIEVALPHTQLAWCVTSGLDNMKGEVNRIGLGLSSGEVPFSEGPPESAAWAPARPRPSLPPPLTKPAKFNERQYLRGGDDGLARQVALLDHQLLRQEDLLGGDLHAQVAAGNLHAWRDWSSLSRHLVLLPSRC